MGLWRKGKKFSFFDKPIESFPFSRAIFRTLSSHASSVSHRTHLASFPFSRALFKELSSLASYWLTLLPTLHLFLSLRPQSGNFFFLLAHTITDFAYFPFSKALFRELASHTSHWVALLPTLLLPLLILCLCLCPLSINHALQPWRMEAAQSTETLVSNHHTIHSAVTQKTMNSISTAIKNRTFCNCYKDLSILFCMRSVL
jgi:hypothetical protein